MANTGALLCAVLWLGWLAYLKTDTMVLEMTTVILAYQVSLVAEYVERIEQKVDYQPTLRNRRIGITPCDNPCCK
jgi:hypothetical protein